MVANNPTMYANFLSNSLLSEAFRSANNNKSCKNSKKPFCAIDNIIHSNMMYFFRFVNIPMLVIQQNHYCIKLSITQNPDNPSMTA